MKNNKFNILMKKVIIKGKKYSPEIMVVAGVTGTVVSTVMACRATTKLSTIMDETHETIEAVNNAVETKPDKYSEEDAKKDLRIIYVQSGLKVAKLYGPSVIVGATSIVCILASHGIIKKRHAALAASYMTLDTTFKDYRNRVVERFGSEVDKELRYNIQSKKIEETVTDDKGKEKKVKNNVGIATPDAYSCFFNKETSNQCEDNMDYNLMFLKAQQQFANDKLKADGYLFLGDVYEELGLKRDKRSQCVGWVYNPDGNDDGDNYVDFRATVVNIETEDGGYEKTILLDFNVDGPILDLI